MIIAVKLMVPDDGGERKEIPGSQKLWQAVRVVALADIVMSLDNVIAIAAVAKGDPALFILGLAASVPLIIAGAAIVMSLLTRFPILVWAGAGLLGWVAGELIATDPAVERLLGSTFDAWAFLDAATLAAVVGALLVIGVGGALRQRRLARFASKET
jgi:predicted tellurium resistance membrane protein TerC